MRYVPALFPPTILHPLQGIHLIMSSIIKGNNTGRNSTDRYRLALWPVGSETCRQPAYLNCLIYRLSLPSTRAWHTRTKTYYSRNSRPKSIDSINLKDSPASIVALIHACMWEPLIVGTFRNPESGADRMIG